MLIGEAQQADAPHLLLVCRCRGKYFDGLVMQNNGFEVGGMMITDPTWEFDGSGQPGWLAADFVTRRTTWDFLTGPDLI